ncbi:MAG: hypothetical protein AAFZ92_05145 [Pseudomonadota bacterium]
MSDLISIGGPSSAPISGPTPISGGKGPITSTPGNIDGAGDKFASSGELVNGSPKGTSLG